MSDWLNDVHGLADGELSPAERQSTERLVAEDPKASAEYRWVLFLREKLQSSCKPIPNAECWQSAMKRLDEIDSSKRAEHFVGRYAWALCALFLVSIMAGAIVNRGGTGREVPSAYVGNLFSHLTPVQISESRSDSSNLLEESIGREPVVSVDQRFDLHGMDRGWANGKRAVRMHITDTEGPLTLVVIDDSIGIEGMEAINSTDYYQSSVNQLPCLLWRERGFTLMLIGQRSPSGLIEAAEALRETR